MSPSGAGEVRVEGVGTTLRAAALVMAGLAALVLIWEVAAPRRETATGLAPHRAPSPAMGHAAAAAVQQGLPTTAAEARAALDGALRAAREQARGSENWSDHARIGAILLSRARLDGEFQDYVDAGTALEAAFKVAPAGSGPHLDRAEWSLAVHRIAAIAPDLERIDAYAVSDAVERGAVLELRGDVAFYSGRYREALSSYQRAAQIAPGVGADLRLANYHAKMGAPEIARAFLDQADARIGGPQQQLRAYIEMRRAVLALHAGQWEEAERRLRRADDIFPGYPVVEDRLARVRALRGAPDEALAIFRAIAGRGEHPEVFDAIAAIHRTRGEVSESRSWAARARAAWERRLALLPEAAMGHAVEHLLAAGDAARALELAQRDYANRPFGDSAVTLASAHLANRNAPAALAVLRPALAAGWKTPEAHVMAAQAYAVLGDGRRADAERRAALALNPRSLDRNAGLVLLE